MDLWEALNGFRRWLELSRSPSTAYEYSRIATKFVSFCGKSDSSELSMNDVIGFVSRYGNKTTAMKVSHALRRFLVFIGREDLARQMPFPREFKRRFPKVLSEEDIKRVLSELDPTTRAIVAVAYWCGLRISEVLLLRREDVDLNNLKIIVTRVKNRGGSREKQELPLAPWVAEILKQYLETRSDNDPRLFPMSREAVRKRFKKFAKKIGIEASFHILRHSRGTELAKQGLSTAEIAAWLHHRSEDVSMIYVHLGADELRKILSRSIPFNSEQNNHSTQQT